MAVVVVVAGMLAEVPRICVVIVSLCVCVCVCSYLLWSTAAGASEEAQPFLPVPFTLSQHTSHKTSCVQLIEREGVST